MHSLRFSGFGSGGLASAHLWDLFAGFLGSLEQLTGGHSERTNIGGKSLLSDSLEERASMAILSAKSATSDWTASNGVGAVR